MRVIPRLRPPSAAHIRRAIGRWRRRVTAARVVVVVEAVALAAVLSLVLSGSSAAYLDRLGSRADIVALAGTLVAFGVLHSVAAMRLVSRLERRLAPPSYDEHRVLLDLSHEVR